MKNSKWDLFDIVVFTENSELNNLIDESISEVIPELETKINCFDSYEECYDWSKEHQSMNLFFISDQNDVETIFAFKENLAKHYEKLTGLKAHFVIVSNSSSQNPELVFRVKKNDSFLDYIDLKIFENKYELNRKLNDIYDEIKYEFECSLIPNSVQKILINEFNKKHKISFSEYLRIFNIISLEANLNWVDEVNSKWAIALEDISPILLNTFPELSNLRNETDFNYSDFDQEYSLYASKTESLATKIKSFLFKCMEANSVEKFYLELNKKKAFREKGFIKILRRNENKIYGILTNSESIKKVV